MCELEPELRGGAEAGAEDVFEVDVGRFEGAVVEQRRQAVCEHVAGPTREPAIKVNLKLSIRKLYLHIRHNIPYRLS